MSFYLEPFGKRIIAVRRLAPKKLGNIIVPENYREAHAPCEADVVSVNAAGGAEIAVGDHIVYNEHSGTQVDLNESDRLTIIPVEDVLAIIRERKDEPK